MDKPDLIDLFARLVLDEFGLPLPEDLEPLEIDPKLKTLLDAYTDQALVGTRGRPGR